MQRLPSELWPAMRPHLGNDRGGRLLGPHAMLSGVGEWWVDRWPQPRTFALCVGGNLALHGDGQAMAAPWLRDVVAEQLRSWDRIFIEVTVDWEAFVLSTLGALQRWERVMLQPRDAAAVDLRPAAGLRPLASEDSAALDGLSGELQWVSDPWGGSAGLARTGRAWGAWSGGRLVSVAAPGFVGDIVEDIFVVTEPDFRGRGLSPQCAARVMEDIRRAGKTPSWTTWPANHASLRVAAKLGFVASEEDHTWIAGQRL